MTGTFRRLRHWLDDLPIADPLQRRHAVTLQVLAMALCVATASIGAWRAATGQSSAAVSAINGLITLVAIVSVVVLRRGRYHAAAVIFVAGYGFVQAVAFMAGGLQFSRDGLKSIALVLTLAALVAGRRALWSMLGVFVVAMGVAYARDLRFLGGIGPRLPPSSMAGVLWSTIGSFLIIAIVLDRFGLTVQESLADRRRAEEALRNSEALFRVAFESSPNAIAISRLDDGVQMAVNQGFIQLMGFSREEAVGRTSADLGVWVDRAARDEAMQRLDRDGTLRDFEATLRRRDGSTFPATIFAQRFELGGRPHMLSVTRDLTPMLAVEKERAQLQAQLLQSQKLESIGRVAGGVAHDLNNLLTAVLGYTDLLETGLVTEQQQADLEQIRLGGQRAAALTRQLLSFARKQPIEPSNVEVNALIASLGGLLKRLIGEHIEFVVRPGAPAVVRADPGQLEQVVLNLVVNARDAMPAGGTLSLETRVAPAAEMAQRGIRLAPVDHVVISVTDTGSGMPPEVVQHLFEPFFTTKEPGKGTGLGLATCYGIVQQAGGDIGVETAPGKGSSFHVYLPRLAQQSAPGPEALASATDGGSETVLLVEDEQQLRVLASRILRGHGYRVLEAADGVQGLVEAASHEGHIDLLLTDVVMPRLGGRELADRLRAIRPGLRVLFASGYSETPVDVSAQGNTFLQKPFTAATLLHRVRQALDA